MAHKVFVYGSLLKGFGNHQMLTQDGAKFLSITRTTGNFTMYDLGGFPAVVDKRTSKSATHIRGEVYLVTDRGLRALDCLEGYDPKRPAIENLYERREIKLDNGSKALTYLMTPSTVSQITGYGRRHGVVESGDWRTYIAICSADCSAAFAPS